jgi:WhiB family redox-sensing transcriptional regulator
VDRYVGDSPKAEYSDVARAMGAGCPVRQDCLEYALADRTITGLWGGQDDRELRRELRRERRRQWPG